MLSFEISKEWLKRGISNLKNTLAKDSPNAITKHYLFDIKDSKLTVKSTNMSLSSIWIHPIESKDQFSFTVPGDTFTSLLGTLDANSVSFEYDSQSKDVKVTCGKYTWDAASGEVLDFPNVTVPEDLEEINLPPEFQTFLRSVAFSTSNDLTKVDLSSLCFDINKDTFGKVNLLTTDRIRLSCSSFNLDLKNKDHVRLIIPKNSLSEIMKFEPTKMKFDKSLRKAYFFQEDHSGLYVFQTVLANTPYPEIYSYLSGDFSGESETIKVKRQDLTRALKRIVITSDRSIGKFTFTKGNLSISTLNEINTSKSKESLEAEYSLDSETSFNVNVNHLIDYISQERLDVISFKVVKGKCLVFDKTDYRHVLSLN